MFFVQYCAMDRPYRILNASLESGDKQVIVLSDLHVGNAKTRYEACWNAMMKAVRRGNISWVVINGDLTDRQPFAAPDSDHPPRIDQATHEQHLRDMLDQLMTADPKLKVAVLLGNHDRAEAYQALLDEMEKKYASPATGAHRFQSGHVMLLGKDSVFTHGDFGPSRTFTAEEVAADERKSVQRAETRKGNHTTRAEGLPEMHDGLMRLYDEKHEEFAAHDPQYRRRSHLFFSTLR